MEDPIGCERIASFDSKFSLTESGIHRPKIIVCRGTAGSYFKQLVKGEDDIRQDAIMQQVFQTVNNLFCKQTMTKNETLQNESDMFHMHGSTIKNRKLNIVTYSCIPLSPASGVLEWVDNTIPFGNYLIDKGSKTDEVGAHSRYYPGEWGNALCLTYLKEASSEEKRSKFDEICKNFSPCFRFFFQEQFSHLQAWHGEFFESIYCFFHLLVMCFA